MLNVKLDLALTFNVKMDPINLQFDVQWTPELILSLNVDVKVGPDYCSLT